MREGRRGPRARWTRRGATSAGGRGTAWGARRLRAGGLPRVSARSGVGARGRGGENAPAGCTLLTSLDGGDSSPDVLCVPGGDHNISCAPDPPPSGTTASSSSSSPTLRSASPSRSPSPSPPSRSSPLYRLSRTSCRYRARSAAAERRRASPVIERRRASHAAPGPAASPKRRTSACSAAVQRPLRGGVSGGREAVVEGEVGEARAAEVVLVAVVCVLVLPAVVREVDVEVDAKRARGEGGRDVSELDEAARARAQSVEGA